MTVEKTAFVSNKIESLEELREVLGEFATGTEMSERAANSANLCLEEAFTNIVRHGYETGAERLISVTFSRQGGSLKISMADDGREFNPLQVRPPEPRPANLVPGGLGIKLLLTLADNVEYKRKDGRNILEIFLSMDRA